MSATSHPFNIGFNDDYILIKYSQNPSDSLVKIHSSGEVSSADDSSFKKHSSMPCQGIFGLYVISIIKAEEVGKIYGHSILKVISTKISLIGEHTSSDVELAKHDQHLLELLRTALLSKSYYFSYTMDITSSLQRQYSVDPNLPLYKKISPVIIPIINGYFASKELEIKNQPFTIRTRYFSRGVDEEGNVSNYAETEQIVEIGKFGNDVFKKYHGELLSYLQLRGSVPIKWAQVINGKYKPSLEINLNNSSNGFQKHMDKLTNDYQRSIMVNLVDKVKYEKPVGDAFAQLSRNLPEDGPVQYYHFDFHKECSKMRFDRVSLLIDKIRSLIDSYQSFEVNPFISDKPTKLQSGIIRTNCMDCLDRTNVVQSVVSSDWMIKEFRNMGILNADETFKNYERVTSALRIMWADNADYVSMAYSGTGALKTDFTRTGKRTKMGLLSDGYNSLERYYRNNFSDGCRQVSFSFIIYF
ncbi:Phosphatidylinositide phosphatase SAC1 [Smittium mucronatum]|uniref:Phosphatidylinositide phosphatase SAC1 n=1 Tax=Smittium mucronatum TaxID=133383 RepID=A0A1R0H3Y3_9FUNG|nr:Phosphatidylinositide phosphatase SAC1 [Smittium mucronatum]